MNIAYIWQREDVDMDRVSGPVLHVTAVIKALQRRGHQVRLITYKHGQTAYTDDLVGWHRLPSRNSDAPWFRLPERAIRGTQSRLGLPYARLFDSMRFADAVLPALKEYDLIYERHDLQGSGGLMVGKRLGIPVILELNGDVFEEYHALGVDLTPAQWRVINQVTRRTFHSADHIVTVSDPLRETTISRWKLDPEHVSVVTNGVDADVFVGAPSTDKLKPEWRANGKPIIIHVGSFQPWHSLDLLVNAFECLAADVDVQLFLVGDGQLKPDIQKLVELLRLYDHVTFTGNVSHATVAQLLNQADIAVLAHRPTATATSGTPLKLLEYMAAGKAIVAPNLGNIASVVTDRYTALLFEPGNVTSLCAALDEILKEDELRLKLGREARKIAVTQHSWDNTAAKLEHIFSRFVEPG